jgi:tRNA pseudouridine55 synthase
MHGFLAHDKVAGPSSAQAIAVLRRGLPGKVRIGHAGTLDPFATGLLLVLLGDATRLSSLAMALPKEYEATVRFGVGTDTLDPTGEVTASADPGPAPPAGLAAAAASFLGEIDQVPPAFSALKVGGRRAYRLARQGEAPVLAPRRVRIDRIGILGTAWPDVRLSVACGAGTYLRAIARDLGQAIGLPAHLIALRRTRIGPFVAGADHGLRPPRELTRAAGLPEAVLAPDMAHRFARGQPAACGLGGTGEAAVVLAEPEGVLLGLGRFAGGLLRPHLVLPSGVEAIP